MIGGEGRRTSACAGVGRGSIEQDSRTAGERARSCMRVVRVFGSYYVLIRSRCLTALRSARRHHTATITRTISLPSCCTLRGVSVVRVPARCCCSFLPDTQQPCLALVPSARQTCHIQPQTRLRRLPPPPRQPTPRPLQTNAAVRNHASELHQRRMELPTTRPTPHSNRLQHNQPRNGALVALPPQRKRKSQRKQRTSPHPTKRQPPPPVMTRRAVPSPRAAQMWR